MLTPKTQRGRIAIRPYKTKKTMKNFVKPKYSRMFAMFNAKEHIFNIVCIGIFYAIMLHIGSVNNTGYQTPLCGLPYSNVSKCSLARTEGDSLSYIYTSTNNFITQMPKNNEITNSVNNSNGIGTPYGAKSVISSTQSNVQGCNISGNIKYIKIINGISSNQLRNTLKSVLSEFIDNGFIDLKQSKL